MFRSALFLTWFYVFIGGARAGTSCKKSADCPKREVCTLGSCTCPVLFRGPGCRAPQPAVARGCIQAFANWPSKGYNPPGIDFGHCAVVGSSSIMKGSGHGKDIDKATAVFRFNEAPVKGHEVDVGKWRPSTIRMQNKERGGFAERAGERCVVWSTNEYSKSRSNGWCKVTRMSPSLEEYAGKYFRRHAQGGKRVGPQMAKMSNGFLGVVMALHLCGKVDVYGFDQGTGYYFKKFVGRPKGWGANKSIQPSTRPFAQRHSWTAERQCMKILGSRMKEVTLYTKGGKISGGATRKSIASRADAAARRAAVAVGAGSRPLWQSKRWRQEMNNATLPEYTRVGASSADGNSSAVGNPPESLTEGGNATAGGGVQGTPGPAKSQDVASFLRSFAVSR